MKWQNPADGEDLLHLCRWSVVHFESSGSLLSMSKISQEVNEVGYERVSDEKMSVRCWCKDSKGFIWLQLEA